MNFYQFLEKITQKLGWEDSARNWIIGIYEDSYESDSSIEESWIKAGGVKLDSIPWQFAELNIQSNLYALPNSFQIEINLCFTFQKLPKHVGASLIGSSSFAIVILPEKTPFMGNLAHSIDHEFSHLANLIRHRPPSGQVAKIGRAHWTQDEIMSKYFSHPGEIDAMARSTAELYKREYSQTKNFR